MIRIISKNLVPTLLTLTRWWPVVCIMQTEQIPLYLEGTRQADWGIERLVQYMSVLLKSTLNGASVQDAAISTNEKELLAEVLGLHSVSQFDASPVDDAANPVLAATAP